MVTNGKAFHEDKALKVILDDEKVYLNVLNSQNTDKKGPQIIYTSPNRKKEHPLNMTVAKYYLKKMGIFSDKLKHTKISSEEISDGRKYSLLFRYVKVEVSC